MTKEDAVNILVDHRNGMEEVSFEQYQAAKQTLNGHHLEWVNFSIDPAAEGVWVLYVDGNYLYRSEFDRLSQ